MNVNIRPYDSNKDLFRPKGDLQEILEIENKCFDEPWDEKTFNYFIKQPGSGCFVALLEDQIVGYLLFEVNKSYFNLVNVAIDPEVRRCGFATILVAELTHGRLIECKRIYCTVSDKNLDVHLFLNKFGFKAISTKRDFFGVGHDGYEFMYLIKKVKKTKSPKKPKYE